MRWDDSLVRIHRRRNGHRRSIQPLEPGLRLLVPFDRNSIPSPNFWWNGSFDRNGLLQRHPKRSDERMSHLDRKVDGWRYVRWLHYQPHFERCFHSHYLPRIVRYLPGYLHLWRSRRYRVHHRSSFPFLSFRNTDRGVRRRIRTDTSLRAPNPSSSPTTFRRVRRRSPSRLDNPTSRFNFAPTKIERSVLPPLSFFYTLCNDDEIYQLCVEVMSMLSRSDSERLGAREILE